MNIYTATIAVSVLLFTGATIFFVGDLLDGFGGFSTTIEELTRQNVKRDLTAWHGRIGEGTEWPTARDFLVWLVIVDLAWSIVYAVSPWQSGRHLMARNEYVVLRASIYACFAVIFMQILIYGAGGFINLANADIQPSETVMLWAARNFVPPCSARCCPTVPSTGARRNRGSPSAPPCCSFR